MAIVTPQNAGGTGFTTYTDGQLLIGSSKDNALHRATLTSSTGVTIVTGNGSITISATGLGGTVTSLTGGTNIALSPATITTTGSIAVTGPPAVTSLTANDLVLGNGTGPLVAAADWSISSNNVLIGNLNVAAGPTGIGTPLRLVQADGFGSSIEFLTANNGFNVFNNIVGRQSRGTLASPAATSNLEVLMQIEGRGYDTTNGYAAGASGAVVINATQNWTSTAHGTDVNFYGTPQGSTTVALAGWFGPNGSAAHGTTTNDSAPAGFKGEYLEAHANTTPFSSGVSTDITSLPLTAGDWDVEGTITTNASGTCVISVLQGWINTASATPIGFGLSGMFYFGTPTAAGGQLQLPTGPIRLSVPSPTTAFLSANVTFSGAGATCGIYGQIRARRRW